MDDISVDDSSFDKCSDAPPNEPVVVESSCPSCSRRSINSECTTSTKSVVLTQRWSISNFDSLLKLSQPGDCLRSDVFSDEAIPDVNWQLCLYPGGKREENSNNVSLFLKMSATLPNKEVVHKAEYRFYFLDDKDEPKFSNANLGIFHATPPKGGHSWGLRNIPAIKVQNSLRADKSLMISCSVELIPDSVFCKKDSLLTKMRESGRRNNINMLSFPQMTDMFGFTPMEFQDMLRPLLPGVGLGVDKMSKKFVNQIEDVVDDSLNGLVLANRGIQFHPTCRRVVVRSDIQQYRQSKVALIAGGGSGHEPYAAGYVGKGLLTAAVAGNVFASPPSRHVQAALDETKSPGGAILFIINYTGDRLNFGLAAERFDGNVKVVTIADDVAIDTPNNRVGRRGLAGAVLTIKIAGSMAEQDESIDKIHTTCDKISNNIGTLGASLYPGAIPGKAPETTLKEDEIEIGLGIHGEPGKIRTKYVHIKSITSTILNTLKSKMNLVENEKVVVLVNNLGGVSQVESNIIDGEVIEWFTAEKISVERFFSGCFMTSLDGHGFSITVLKVFDQSIIEHLDFSTDAPGWISSSQINSDPRKPTEASALIDVTEIETSGPSQAPDLYLKIVEDITKAMLESEPLLNKLDAIAGDGDCGSTFASAARSIQSSMNKLSFTHPQTLLRQLAILFEQAVGGTSGALYALMLSSASSAFGTDSITGENCVRGLAKGNEAVQTYGGARPGDRTMVDSLNAAVEYLKNQEGKNETTWAEAVKAAEQAAEATAQQVAAVGRASYTSSEAQTHPDAGATAIAIWLRTIYKTIYG